MREALRAVLGTAKHDAPLSRPMPGDAWRENWRDLAGLALTGSCVPEEMGGFGLQADAAAAAAAGSTAAGSALHRIPASIE